MVTMTLIAVAGAWTVLALFASEMRRQANDIELAAQIAARKAQREAIAAAAAAELIAKAKSSASRSPFRPAR
jgi:hypothetical protein